MDEPDSETLKRRLDAVERAVTDRDGAPEAALRETTADEELTDRLDEIEQQVDELDAALQAVRGFLGGVDAVNESVEARAEAAVAAVERLEHRLDENDVDEGSRDSHGSEVVTANGPDSPTGTTETPLAERLRDRW